MNDRLEQAKYLVKQWIPRLGMQSWEIDVYVSVDSDDGWTMCAHHQDNYDRGSIEIHPRVLCITPPDPINKNFDHDVSTNDLRFEKLIVHELLHLLIRRRDRAHRRMSDNLPEDLRGPFAVLVEDADEEIVEQLARTLVALSPVGLKEWRKA